MKLSGSAQLETDPRFPSGPWTGYFLQPAVPGRHLMDLLLTFQQGQMTGEGRDYVGDFIVRGQYFLADGKCHWTKRYARKHDVFYQGYNEGKGIWGIWEIPATRQYGTQRGGFYIWPEGMGDSTQPALAEQAEMPLPVAEPIEHEEQVAEPVGAHHPKPPREQGWAKARLSTGGTGDRGKGQLLLAVAAHSPVAHLPCMVAQFAFAPRTAEMIDGFDAGPA